MTWPWITLLALGAWHGLNPAMGWLFAVSRGLQERSGRAVAGALLPIALGHGLAIALALAVVAIGRASLPLSALRWATAAVLIGAGIARLVRHRHPRWVGMRVGFRDLTVWSFLMANAHGAGLMVAPLFVVDGARPSCHVDAGVALTGALDYVVATAAHTAAMLAITATVALIVYYKLGLALLRRTWFNLDSVWALALIAAGLFALVAGGVDRDY
jgi:hypothetical protein